MQTNVYPHGGVLMAVFPIGRPWFSPTGWAHVPKTRQRPAFDWRTSTGRAFP